MHRADAMRKQLPETLRAFAANMADPQHAALVAALREAADELELRHAPDMPSDPAPATASVRFDSDGIPSFVACVNCWDE
jgi:hypothetical protein